MSDDLISRSEAIEVADAVWSVTGDKNVAKVWDQIKNLPSAQPEIIRCKVCKYHPNNSRPYADDDPIETFIHCQFMEASDFCSKGKRMEVEE